MLALVLSLFLCAVSSQCTAVVSWYCHDGLDVCNPGFLQKQIPMDGCCMCRYFFKLFTANMMQA